MIYVYNFICFIIHIFWYSLVKIIYKKNRQILNFYYTFFIGSIITISNEKAKIIEKYAYDVFGKPYSKKKNGKITKLKKSKIGNTRMYTGREYDRGLKLYYNRARYYNPKLGRFISRDPIDIADDVNLYSYVGNNGVMFVDLSGKSKKFMETHDATSLLLQYMTNAREELSFSGKLPKFGLSHKRYFENSLSSKWNIKYNEEFLSLAYDTNKESCEGRGSIGGGACIVFIEGEKIELSEIGNFLIGYNGNYAGFTLNSNSPGKIDDIYKSGMFIEYELHNLRGINRSYDDALSDELIDRPWYNAGYKMAKSEIRKNWGLQENSISLKNSISNIK